jgi:predicted histone-like DNA-binding protein
VTVQELAERAAEISTLSSADVAAAIEAFLTIVPDELADGNVVSLGNSGSFRHTTSRARFAGTRDPHTEGLRGRN